MALNRREDFQVRLDIIHVVALNFPAIRWHNSVYVSFSKNCNENLLSLYYSQIGVLLLWVVADGL